MTIIFCGKRDVRGLHGALSGRERESRNCLNFRHLPFRCKFFKSSILCFNEICNGQEVAKIIDLCTRVRPKSAPTRPRKIFNSKFLTRPYRCFDASRYRVLCAGRARAAADGACRRAPSVTRRRVWDSDPRNREYRLNGFQDRRVQPLRQPSLRMAGSIS